MKLFKAKEEKNLLRVIAKAQDEHSRLLLEELHGILFGLAITPELIMPGDWIGLVFGEGEPLFDSDEDAQDCLDHLVAAYNRMIGENYDGKLRFPFKYKTLTDEDFDLIADWTYGLFLALSLRPEIWGMTEQYAQMNPEQLPEELRDVIGACVIITAIAFPEQLEEIYEESQDDQPGSLDDLENEFYEMLPVCIKTLQQHAKSLRDKNSPDNLH